MSETETNGEKPLTIYDVHTDEKRPVTQADIDLLVRRVAELGIFWSDLRTLVEKTKAQIAS